MMRPVWACVTLLEGASWKASDTSLVDPHVSPQPSAEQDKVFVRLLPAFSVRMRVDCLQAVTEGSGLPPISFRTH
jgi:hypothetical protein